MKKAQRKKSQGSSRQTGLALLLYITFFIILSLASGMAARDLFLTLGVQAAALALAAVLRRAELRLAAVLPVLVFCAVGAYVVGETLAQGTFTWFSQEDTPMHVYGVLWVLALYAALFAVVGSARAAVAAGTAITLLFGVVNYALMAFRGRLFLAVDVTSLSTAMSVAGNYTLEIGAVLVSGILMSLTGGWAGWQLCAGAAGQWRWRGIFVRCACAAAVAVYAVLFFQTNLLSRSGIYITWNENDYEESSVMYFMITLQKLAVTEPADYSDENLDTIAAEIENESENTGVNPHIIVIVSESFSDLRQIGAFETNTDVLPFFDSLSENTIQGYVYSSVRGGNTANSEFEFLTGNTMAYIPTGSVPYQLYIHYEKDTMVSILEEQGYTSVAMHPYYASGWNREEVYDLFGFDEVHFIDDYQNPRKLRGYVTDESDYAYLIERFEAREEGEKLFLFNITMQNHGGYTSTSMNSTVQVTGWEGLFPETEQYLTLMNITDTATQELFAYFETQEEPVMILFFGDHQPNLESGFYELLYGKMMADLTDEEEQRRYITPFYIWANYDIEEAELGYTSINYLGQILLEAAGLEYSDYGAFLKDLRTQYPVINAYGCYDAAGNWYSLSDAAVLESSALWRYQLLQYNYLFDTNGYRSDIFALSP